MTATDWVGLVLNVVVFFALSAIFYWALRPKNKARLEAHKHLPFVAESSQVEQADER